MVKFALSLLVIFLTGAANAAPIGELVKGEITITLTDEPCKLKAVSNMKRRATWTQGKKTFEGCYAGFMEAQAVGMYFSDKTFAVVPVDLFRPAHQI
jgi:hypothetical protein